MRHYIDFLDALDELRILNKTLEKDNCDYYETKDKITELENKMDNFLYEHSKRAIHIKE